MTTYADFLDKKTQAVPDYGFEINPATLHPALKDFQRSIVKWALKKGRAALFEDCGLGKSLQQLVWGQEVARYTGGKVLLFAPLAVAQQTVQEGVKFGIEVQYCKDQAEADKSAAPIVITNYERLESFEIPRFSGVILDESSVLKSFMGKIKRALIVACADVRYKLACTATPSPNDVMELGNHADWLGIMSSTEILTRWFANDQSQAGNYRLKKHAESDYWQWVASWAVCIASPSDLGAEYSSDGYDLPGLFIREHIVQVDHSEAPEMAGTLFRMPSLSATGLHKELRATMADRAAAAAALVAAEPDEQWVVWCNTNDEADALKRSIPGAVEVRGSMTPEQKERDLLGFARGEFKVLVTKSSIAGFGLNYQNCARMAFVGLSYSYEAFYQALRRAYRFGQQREVHAHVIVAETEVGIKDTVARKQRDHYSQQQSMIQAMRESTLEGVYKDLRLTVGEGHMTTERGKNWTMHNGDCCEVTAKLAANSVGLMVFSPPFSNLYTYSPNLRDMGNTENDSHFFEHYGYLVPELLRITKPGRVAAIHAQDLVRYKGSSGAAGLRDFSGEVIRAMEAPTLDDGSRWVYHGRITIWKSPVTEMQRTKANRLLYKTLRTNAGATGVGRPDYVLLFRKWTPEGMEVDPVLHTKDGFPLDQWQTWASPVWFDIDQQDVLNYQIAKSDADSKHICPLQLGVIERCIELWTNPGDLVFDPFMGIGSSGFQALKMGRRAAGTELKSEYFAHAIRNLKAAESDGQQALFEPEELAESAD